MVGKVFFWYIKPLVLSILPWKVPKSVGTTCNLLYSWVCWWSLAMKRCTSDCFLVILAATSKIAALILLIWQGFIIQGEGHSLQKPTSSFMLSNVWNLHKAYIKGIDAPLDIFNGLFTLCYFIPSINHIITSSKIRKSISFDLWVLDIWPIILPSFQ